MLSLRLLCLPLLLVGGPAAAVSFDFAPVVVSTATFGSFASASLSNAGQVAFTASVQDADFNSTDLVLRGDAAGGSPVEIASTGGDAPVFSRFGETTINAAGQIGFEGSFDQVTGEGIFRGAGGAVTTIAGTRDAGDFDFVNAGPSLNAGGTAAFVGERIVGGAFIAGVYAGNGGPVFAIVDESDDFGGDGFDFFTGNPSLNDAGQAAFLAVLDSGTGGLFVGANGVFDLVAAEGGPFSSVFSFGDPSLNEAGAVAFAAGTSTDPTDPTASTGRAVLLFRNGMLTTVYGVQIGGVPFNDLGDPSLNNLGQVAFLGTDGNFSDTLLLGGQRVIGPGDSLFGKLVTDIDFAREGLNDLGQLAFIASFDDGSTGVFLATPAAVPEPGVWAMTIVGIGVVGGAMRRRRRIAHPAAPRPGPSPTPPRTSDRQPAATRISAASTRGA